MILYALAFIGGWWFLVKVYNACKCVIKRTPDIVEYKQNYKQGNYIPGVMSHHHSKNKKISELRVNANSPQKNFKFITFIEDRQGTSRSLQLSPLDTPSVYTTRHEISLRSTFIHWNMSMYPGGGNSSLSGSPLNSLPGPPPKPPPRPRRPSRGPLRGPGMLPKGPIGSNRAPGGTDPLGKG